MEKKIDYKEFDFGEDLDLNTCSNMDCTGAVPVPPKSKAEKESYKNVYDYEPIVFIKDENEKK